MKWFELIYKETNPGKSIATTVSGIIGLVVYNTSSDWVYAVFSLVISFPLVRLISDHFVTKSSVKEKVESIQEKADNYYNNLSDSEKQIVAAFIENDSCVITWRQFNEMNLPSLGCESLLQRGLIETSITADGLKETFVLDSLIFDAARRNKKDS